MESGDPKREAKRLDVNKSGPPGMSGGPLRILQTRMGEAYLASVAFFFWPSTEWRLAAGFGFLADPDDPAWEGSRLP